MGAVLLALMLCVAQAWADPRPPPRTPQAALQVAPEYVDLRRARQFTLVANQLAAMASRAVSVGLVAPRTLLDALDFSGPGFMASTDTVGARTLSVGVFGLSSLYGTLDGQGLNGGSLEGLNPIVFLSQTPDAPPIVAATLAYDIGLRQSVAAVTATYGVLDHLDVSLVLPIVHTELDLGVDSDIVAQGEDFTPVHLPTQHGETHLAATGVGDLSLRFKWNLPFRRPRVALMTAVQFPTGDPLKLTGTGDYWLSLGAAFGYSFWSNRVNALLNVGVDFDVNRATMSQVTYSAGVAAWVVPRRLNLGLMFLGQSQLDEQLAPGKTGVLTLAPDNSLQTLPALGVMFDRQDIFSAALSARLVLGFGFLLFVGAVFPLGSQGLQTSVATPVAGIGGVW